MPATRQLHELIGLVGGSDEIAPYNAPKFIQRAGEVIARACSKKAPRPKRIGIVDGTHIDRALSAAGGVEKL